jgi:gamma-glutamyl phosphate reductase
MTSTKEILIRAKEASRKMAGYSDSHINRALLLIGECLIKNTYKILSANEKDLSRACNSIPEVMKD